MSMGLPTSPSSHFSFARPSRLLLDESSLGEAQTKHRFSPNTMRLYMSNALDDTMKNRHEAANRIPCYVDDTELHGSPANSVFYRQLKAGSGSDESNTESAMARMPKDDSGSDSSCGGRSFNSAVETWRPPKPAKPFFLSAPRSFSFDNISSDPENAQYTTDIFPGREKDGGEIGHLVHGLQSSPPPEPRTPFRTTLSVNRATRSEVDRTLKRQQGKPRVPVRESIWRQPLQSTSHCSPDRLPFTLPIDDPERPFPHPIPTIDRLPLRTKNAVCSQSEKEKGQAKSVESNEGFFSHPKEAFLDWVKTRSFALVSFSLYGPTGEGELKSLSSKSNSYVLCVGTMWSTFGDINAYTKDHRRQNVSRFPKEEPACLLRISIIIPAILLRIMTTNGVAVRDYRVSNVLAMVARKLKALFLLVTIFILLALDEIRYNLASRRSQNGPRTA